MFLALVLFTACQDNDIDRSGMLVAAPDAESITGSLQGDDYVWQWTALPEGESMQVAIYKEGTLTSTEVATGNSYSQKNVPTNVKFEYVFKATDGTNTSNGVVKTYTREGAASITGLTMKQVDVADGYDASITWDKAVDATSIKFTATNGLRIINETLSADATSYTVSNVKDGDTWNVTLVAVNDKGAALATTSSLRIGKTTIGFLSTYATADELVRNGDDDEASAWLWLHSQYPSAKFVPFSSVRSAADLAPYRVLFWLHDIETGNVDDVWNMPSDVLAATPAIRQWYKDGGNLLLWGHATVYIGTLGRISTDMLRNNDNTIGCGAGGYNGDIWKMAVQLNPGGKFSIDMSSHPIYNGIETEQTDRTKLIAMKGPGWTEDHNCLFFNIPAALTGQGNQDMSCYSIVTDTYGIYPLATWDSQIDWVSQLNIWEARQGNTDFKGTVLCVGNGGCEFSMKNDDGSADKSAYPKNNAYEDNVLKMAKNSLEYLKTR